MKRVWQLSEAYRQSNRRAIVLSAAFVPLIRMLILAGSQHCCCMAVWQPLPKNVCRYLQCVSVPDPTVALAFDEIGNV